MIKCINCKKELKCNCFSIDLDEFIAPFCSANCLIEWGENKDEVVLECSENVSYDDEKKKYVLFGYGGHYIQCENQFCVKNKELKKLIKELQENRDHWEKVAINKHSQVLELNKRLREVTKKW